MKPFCTDWDEFKDTQMCNAWVATAIVGSSLVGAGASIYSSGKAADAQREATQTAAALQQQQYQQTRADLAPYREAGTDAYGRLKDANFYTDPIIMDQATLEATPGYQFTKTQGEKAVANSAAARGLGVSGAALKGAATFATGLADSTYKTQFDVANTNRTNAYNRLKGLVDTGAAASGATGALGEKAAYNSGAATIAGGNAAAAGANATGGAITNLANNVGGYAAYKGLYGSPSNTSTPNNGSGIYTGDPTIPGFA